MLQDLHDYELLDLPIRASIEHSGDGFYVRAFGGISAQPNAVSAISSALGIGHLPQVGSRSIAIVSSNSGLGFSTSKAFASLL
jgi:hypothetical protein